MEALRDRQQRSQRLDGAHAHLIAMGDYKDALERDPAYARDHHTGVLLMKTPELRLVLELAEPGVILDNPVVHGSATLHVLEGCVTVEAGDDRLEARAGELVALPRHRRRRICAREKSLFLLALAPEARAPRLEEDDMVVIAPPLHPTW